MTPMEIAGTMDNRINVHGQIAEHMFTKCWEWTGTTSTNGYGRIKLRGIKHYCHRVMYVLVYGEIPRDKMVLHHCDNRMCCNPIHLYDGTAANNAQDRASRNPQSFKGHHKNGQDHWAAKITDLQLLTLTLLARVDCPEHILHKIFPLSPSYIHKLVGRRWRIDSPTRSAGRSDVKPTFSTGYTE